jgi:hypothetical protein
MNDLEARGVEPGCGKRNFDQVLVKPLGRLHDEHCSTRENGGAHRRILR